MNVYSVERVTGETEDVEADFFESIEPDLVFFAGGTEVLRVAAIDVVAVTKTPIRPRWVTPDATKVFL